MAEATSKGPATPDAPETNPNEGGAAGLPLAVQLAAKLFVGNYQAMATLISPTLLVTPAHVLSQSGLQSEVKLPVTIEFLGAPGQTRPATVFDVDESRDFAVLQLDAPAAFRFPDNLLQPGDSIDAAQWVSYWLTKESIPISVMGTVLQEQTLNGTTYRQLETISPIPDVAGISGAPVVAGQSLIGIMASGDQGGVLWNMIPITQMINSEVTDAVASLLPSTVPRGKSQWITDEQFRRFSEEAIAVLADARAISREFLKSNIIHIRHLLLAFLRQPDGQLKQMLSTSGVDLIDILKVGPEAFPLVRGNYESLTRVPAMSVNSRNAVSAAIEKAGPVGPVEDAHLLAGVLSANKSPTIRALNDLGITDTAVRVPPTSAHRAAVLAGYQSDDATGTDLLDIIPEVQALASVLAAEDVDPPLSLGLFGDWGTGKSFFMRKLEAEIKRLADDAREAKKQGAKSAYCTNIVQIPFNAWNYIDTDLWASLTSEIFENLAAAIVKERGIDETLKDPDALKAQRELVLAATSSSEAVLEQAEQKKAVAEQELKEIEEKLTNLQRNEAAIESSLTPGEILKQALGFAMQDEQMRNYVEQISDALRIPETKAAASEIQSEILQLKSGSDTIVFALKNDKRLWVWLMVSGLVFAGVWGITRYLVDLRPIASHILATLTSLLVLLVPFAKTVSKAASLVQGVKDAKTELIEKKKREQLATLEKTRETVRQNVELARKNMAEAQEKVKRLNDQLDNMRADRRLADYIRERNQSADYTQHLGIISRVRTDLRNLSTLLREVKEQDQDEFEKGLKKRQMEKDGARKLFPRIDRIILYIDDLDRCPEKNVVEVLQAVHLLLAFPLFVVVVGVDPRWLLYSLQQFSSAFRTNELANNADFMGEGHWQSTPLNYLEKIFQIPYSLRPIDENGFGQLVDQFASPKLVWTPHATTGSSSSETGPPLGPEKASPAPAAPPSAPTAVARIGGPSGVVRAAPTPTVGTSEVGSVSAQPSIQQPSTINRSPEHLKISDAERIFMKQLHEFIPTPRAGKRFINIYRLLRASVTESERISFIGDDQGGTYQAAMLLLAILTGYPEQTTEILRKLIEEKPQEDKKQPELSWWVFIGTLKSAMPPKTMDLSARTETNVKNSEPASYLYGSRWAELIERLERFKPNFGDRALKQFRDWAPRVARYSFQSGRVLYSEQR